MSIASPVTERVSGRSLVSVDLFQRLTRRIVNNDQITPPLAARIMNQALTFLAASAQHTGEPLAPSDLVDIGWHAFLLYTREYAEFCDRVAGRLIHHVPNDDPDAPAEKASPAQVRARTMAAIASAGYTIDAGLWPLSSTNCGDCHEDGNCSASGQKGNENTETRKKT
jgi:hypothetical protein